jgi:hypothetical protein
MSEGAPGDYSPHILSSRCSTEAACMAAALWPLFNASLSLRLIVVVTH